MQFFQSQEVYPKVPIFVLFTKSMLKKQHFPPPSFVQRKPFKCHVLKVLDEFFAGQIYVAANVQIQLMYTLADRPANVYIS